MVLITGDGEGTGKRSVNLVPRPTSLWTSMVPPWAMIILRVVGRPRPVPPERVEKKG
jgi:hypothetical protein